MPPEHHPDPSVHRRRLGRALRDAREAVARSQREAYTAMDWSVSKLLRIEAGSGTITTNDLRALLALYGIEGEQVEPLVEMARAGRAVSHWNVYRDVASAEYLTFLGYESSATTIRSFEPLLVPSLLQTEEYARVVFEILEGDCPERIEPLIDLRVERQEVLTRPRPPDLHFIMDEAVIRRVVGSPAIFRQQLRHLLEVGDYPNVSIKIVPFTAGLHPKLRAPYVLFEFDGEYDHILYVEGPLGDQLSRERVHSYRDRSGSLRSEVYLAEFWRLEHLTNGTDPTKLIREALGALG